MPTALVIIAGLLLGSHMNVLIIRLPGDSGLKGERSMCPKCKTVLLPLDLIPVLSYVMLRGRCRYCKQAISIQYPVVELASAAFMLIAYLKYGLGLEMAIHYLFMAACLIIALTDIRTQMIPDAITLPLLAIFLIAAPFRTSYSSPFDLSLGLDIRWQQLINALLGAISCGGFLYLLAEVSNGKMGGGDIKFIAATGAYLGWYTTLLVLLLGSALGLLVPFLLSKVRMRWGKPVPFGPFLAFAGFLMSNISIDAIFLALSR